MVSRCFSALLSRRAPQWRRHPCTPPRRHPWLCRRDALRFTSLMQQAFRRQCGGGLAQSEMLFQCQLLALLGGGPSPRYLPNKVVIWDDARRQEVSCYFGVCMRGREAAADARGFPQNGAAPCAARAAATCGDSRLLLSCRPARYPCALRSRPCACGTTPWPLRASTACASIACKTCPS